MPQDQMTGVAGDAFGRRAAPLIARAINAAMLGPRSNEAIYQGARIVIKCAASGTTCVGVTYKMLERLDSVIGAFEQEDKTFNVLSLPASIYRKAMRPTRSHGASAGRVGIVSRSVFTAQGSFIRSVRL
jgi:hypothetical protein